MFQWRLAIPTLSPSPKITTGPARFFVSCKPWKSKTKQRMVFRMVHLCIYIYVGFPTTYRQSLVFGLPGKIKDSKLKLQTSELQLFFWMCFIQTKRKIQKVRPKKIYISCSNRSCFWKFLGRKKKKRTHATLKAAFLINVFHLKKVRSSKFEWRL